MNIIHIDFYCTFAAQISYKMKRLKDTSTYLLFNIEDESFEFEIFSLEDYHFDENLDFNEKSGIYMFLRKEKRNRVLHLGEFIANNSNKAENEYEPLYLGKTENFNQRFYDHHKDEDLLKNGVTHIAIHFSSKSTIDRIESLFLHKYSFPLNEMSNEQKGLEVLSAQRALRGKCKNFCDNSPCVHSRDIKDSTRHL